MWRMFFIFLTMLIGATAQAQVLTKNLEIKRINNVGAAWVTVPLSNTYANPVVVCSYVLATKANPDATTRIRNASATSFEVRVQRFENSNVFTPGTVHCVISDEGAYNVGSLKYEARLVKSDGTSGQSAGWGVANTENVTSDVTQTYLAPAVVGQVMSFEDAKASTFWTFDCVNRANPPLLSGSGICVGKQIGQINSTRNTEILGYMVIESGSGTINGTDYAVALGGRTVAGVGNSPPYNYTLSGDFHTAVTTQGGMRGGHGGWATLYGNDPLPNNTISLAVEEETVAGDTTRTHTTERLAYWAFGTSLEPKISAKKGVKTFPGNTSPYALPGNDVIYEISAENTGQGPVDLDTIFIVDAMPSQLTFYNDDIDGPGPETDPIILIDNGSGLTFNFAADAGFSDNAAAPTNLAACSYAPAPGYDPAVTYICLNPKGSFNEGAVTPSSFEFHFRAKIE